MVRVFIVAVAVSLAACSQADDRNSNEAAGSGFSAEASASTDMQDTNSPADEYGADLNGGSTAELSQTGVGDVKAPEQGAPSDELWIGGVGGDGDEKCSRTTGGHIGSTPYIPVQQGQASIISESSDVVVLATTRVDNGKDMKMIFATSQALCEAARRKAL